MIEHVSIPISNMAKSKKFYDVALKSCGYRAYRDYAPEAVGYLEGGSTSLWLARQKSKFAPMHVAVRAKSVAAVKKFHEAGLKAGGKDNGGPGFRESYGPNYYAAFLYDPDGNNIEACYFGARAPAAKKRR